MIAPNRTCFIHPSVFFHDQLSPSSNQAISKLNCAANLRLLADSTEWPEWNPLYSMRSESVRLFHDLSLRYVRTLVSGATGVGKSSLINTIAGQERVSVISEAHWIETSVDLL